MGKRKRRQKGKQAGPPRPAGPPPVGLAARRWSLRHLLLVLLIGFGLGFAAGYAILGGPSATDAGTEAEPEQEIRTDRYGRPPGHPHYGHPHP